MKEADWRRFRKIVPALREGHLRKINQELKALLATLGKTETDRFWDTFERIHKEERILRRCLDGHRRSMMFDFMFSMFRYGMLDESDMEGFSPELREELLSSSRELDNVRRPVTTTPETPALRQTET